jgi:hypothetical protein
MATTATPIFPQTIQSEAVQILNATGTSAVTLYTAGANGSKIENIICTSTDTIAHTIQLSVTISAVTYILTTINIPANSGNTTVLPSISLINNAQIVLAKDPNGNPYLYLGAGAVLKVSAAVTVTSPDVLSFVTNGGDF